MISLKYSELTEIEDTEYSAYINPKVESIIQIYSGISQSKDKTQIIFTTKNIIIIHMHDKDADHRISFRVFPLSTVNYFAFEYKVGENIDSLYFVMSSDRSLEFSFDQYNSNLRVLLYELI